MRCSLLFLSISVAFDGRLGAQARVVPEAVKSHDLTIRNPLVVPDIIPAFVKPKPLKTSPDRPKQQQNYPPKSNPAPGSEPQPAGTKSGHEDGPVVLQDPDALATIKNWKCGRTKRNSLIRGLFKRGFTKADTLDPAKYLQWLETMATDGNGKDLPRDKIVFYTKGTRSMAVDFVNANPGYYHYDTVYGRQFSTDWSSSGYVPEYTAAAVDKVFQAKSEALAKFARNPLVFGADKTISTNDKSTWALTEYPVMQDAGKITKLTDNAKSKDQVDYTIDPPPRKAC